MENKPISVEFHGEPINIIEHSGKRWLASEEVGKCLGYTAGEERRAILKLYKRHRDEFTDQDTGVVNLTTPGGMQQTRIFSDTGCIKLGFFAKTRVGKEFRNFASEKLASAKQPQPIINESVRHELLTARPLWAKIQRYFALGLNGKEIALLLKCSITTVRKHRRRMEACGLLTPPANLAKLQQSGLRLINGGAK